MDIMLNYTKDMETLGMIIDAKSGTYACYFVKATVIPVSLLVESGPLYHHISCCIAAEWA